MQFGDVFRDAHQCRHRAEWLASKVLVEPAANDAHPGVSKALGNVDNSVVEKLRLVDANNVHILHTSLLDEVPQFAAG